MGLKFRSKGIIDLYYNLFASIGDAKWGDVILGVSCMAILLIFRVRSVDLPPVSLLYYLVTNLCFSLYTATGTHEGEQPQAEEDVLVAVDQ